MAGIDLDKELATEEEGNPCLAGCSSSYPVPREKLQKENQGRKNAPQGNAPGIAVAESVKKAVVTAQSMNVNRQTTIREKTEEHGIQLSAEKQGKGIFESLFSEILNSDKDFTGKLRALFNFLDNIRLKALIMIKNTFYELKHHCKCALHAVGNFFKKSLKALFDIADDNQGPVRTISRNLLSSFDLSRFFDKASAKTANPEIRASDNSYFNATDNNKTDLFSLFKKALEAIGLAASEKKERIKHKQQEELAARQKELEIETVKSLKEALFLRPDLAGWLRMPQTAFLASSPFAHAPSADDLIRQAEAEKNEQIH